MALIMVSVLKCLQPSFTWGAVFAVVLYFAAAISEYQTPAVTGDILNFVDGFFAQLFAIDFLAL